MHVSLTKVKATPQVKLLLKIIESTKIFNKKYNEISELVMGRGFEALTFRVLSGSNRNNDLQAG